MDIYYFYILIVENPLLNIDTHYFVDIGAQNCKNKARVQYMASTSNPSSVFEAREQGVSKEVSANSKTRYLANLLSQRSRS